MRLKLYLDTSVLGAVCDPGPEDRLVATHRVLNGLAKGVWEGYISTLVLEELERTPNTVHEKIAQHLRRTPLAVLEETPESLGLARAYVAAGGDPAGL